MTSVQNDASKAVWVWMSETLKTRKDTDYWCWSTTSRFFSFLYDSELRSAHCQHQYAYRQQKQNVHNKQAQRCFKILALCARPWGANAVADRPNTPSTTLFCVLPSLTSPDYFWSSLVPFSHLHFPWPCRRVLMFWQRCMRFFLGDALINEVDSELLALILQRTQGWFSNRRETERLNPH